MAVGTTKNLHKKCFQAYLVDHELFQTLILVILKAFAPHLCTSTLQQDSCQKLHKCHCCHGGAMNQKYELSIVNETRPKDIKALSF